MLYWSIVIAHYWVYTACLENLSSLASFYCLKPQTYSILSLFIMVQQKRFPEKHCVRKTKCRFFMENLSNFWHFFSKFSTVFSPEILLDKEFLHTLLENMVLLKSLKRAFFKEKIFNTYRMDPSKMTSKLNYFLLLSKLTGLYMYIVFIVFSYEMSSFIVWIMSSKWIKYIMLVRKHIRHFNTLETDFRFLTFRSGNLVSDVHSHQI